MACHQDFGGDQAMSKRVTHMGVKVRRSYAPREPLAYSDEIYLPVSKPYRELLREGIASPPKPITSENLE